MSTGRHAVARAASHSAARPMPSSDGECDEAALAEGPGDRPRLDAARRHRSAARSSAAPGAPRRAVHRVDRSASQTRPAIASTASGVQKTKPCAGENSTSRPCGAVQVILRATSCDGDRCAVEALIGGKLRRHRQHGRGTSGERGARRCRGSTARAAVSGRSRVPVRSQRTRPAREPCAISPAATPSAITPRTSSAART